MHAEHKYVTLKEETKIVILWGLISRSWNRPLDCNYLRVTFNNVLGKKKNKGMMMIIK